MLSTHGVPLLVQLVVPLALFAWHIFGANRSLAGWLIKTGLVAGYLVATHYVGLWLVLPWYAALAASAVLAVLAARQFRRVRALPRTAPVSRWSIAGRGTLALVVAAALATAVVARRPPAETIIDLQLPLADGVYHVVAGGNAELLSPHLKTLDETRFAAYRGQSHGVDLVKLGSLGLRAIGVLPSELSRYAIYGDRVLAPCDGTVVHAEDGAPDMMPPEPDRSRMAGNHVLLDCGGVHVLLGHLLPGSVRVTTAQHVAAGTTIGRVGNSGNSNEPHLHVHAQRPALPGREPLSGDPLPIRFDGRYLVRNDRITARHPETP